MRDSLGWFPQYLDDAVTMIILDADEMIPALVMFVAGLVADMVWPGLILTVAYITVLKRYKARYPGGLIIRLLYAVGLFSLPGYPSFLQSEFRE